MSAKTVYELMRRDIPMDVCYYSRSQVEAIAEQLNAHCRGRSPYWVKAHSPAAQSRRSTFRQLQDY